MYTGKYNSKHTGKYSRKPRISRRSILLTVSVLVLCLAMVGGTVAWITTSTAPVQNVFSLPNADITIEEEFDGQVKRNVRIKNTGDVPVFVRVKVLYTYKDQNGNVLPCNESDVYKDRGSTQRDAWKEDQHNTFYYRATLQPGEVTGALYETIQLMEGVTPPEGYTLDVHVIAQCVQAEGTKLVDGQEVPMAIAEGWPIRINGDRIWPSETYN